MNALTRKQREIAGRHTLFLDIARTLMLEEGFHNLSMDRIAEIGEYSKGTVYQHFTCKEEILMQLCISAMTHLFSLFQRAANFDGNHRERLIATLYAHEIWARSDNVNMCLIQHLDNDGVKEKVTPTSLQRHDELEQLVIGSVANIVQDAINDGDLPASSLNPVEIVFGLWSMSYGGQLLQSYDIPLQELGVRDPGNVLTRMVSLTLDGLGWKPLLDEEQWIKTHQRIRKQLFAEELQQIAAAT